MALIGRYSASLCLRLFPLLPNLSSRKPNNTTSPMSPIDRISQLNTELSKLRDTNLILQSQIADAREQAKRDSVTIWKLVDERGNARLALGTIEASFPVGNPIRTTATNALCSPITVIT